MLQYFNYYVKLGFHAVPLYAKSKIPYGKRWNQDWNEDRIRKIFASNNDLNIGILLGKIVDVEGDSKEANDLLDELIGDYPHLCYSGAKSKHHLFLNPDSNLTRVTHQDIEFRAFKHQSVLPPSIHPDGATYRWIDETFPPRRMPDALLKFYREIATTKAPVKPSRRRLPRGWIRPWCTNCQKRETINARRYNLEVEAFAVFGRKWECHSCRNLDLRKICKKLKRK
jgi:hypothetical protein